MCPCWVEKRLTGEDGVEISDLCDVAPRLEKGGVNQEGSFGVVVVVREREGELGDVNQSNDHNSTCLYSTCLL